MNSTTGINVEQFGSSATASHAETGWDSCQERQQPIGAGQGSQNGSQARNNEGCTPLDDAFAICQELDLFHRQHSVFDAPREKASKISSYACYIRGYLVVFGLQSLDVCADRFLLFFQVSALLDSTCPADCRVAPVLEHASQVLEGTCLLAIKVGRAHPNVQLPHRHADELASRQPQGLANGKRITQGRAAFIVPSLRTILQALTCSNRLLSLLTTIPACFSMRCGGTGTKLLDVDAGCGIHGTCLSTTVKINK
uniref:Putative transcription factor mafg n=1 Tax=Rhipicephalus microplus TaxID=6941 RepID=A0A6M2D2D3_RHIMP